MRVFRTLRRPLALLVLSSLIALVGACGANSDPDTATTAIDGVRVISVDAASDLFENQPEDLVVLDVRTPEEFQESRLADAVMIDFYEPDFADRIADLDRDVPYLLYCRSGNRSAGARDIMEDLGFTDVSDIDGGIAAWLEAGQPTIAG